MQPKLSFVQISDTHIGPTRSHEARTACTYDNLERFVTLLNAMPEPPDFVIHTGDITDDGSPASYELAWDLLSRINVPLYLVNGNHDLIENMGGILAASGTPSSAVAGSLCYTFDLKGERFLVLDAFDPGALQPAGCLGDAQLAFLRAETEGGDLPLTVFLHFPPLPMGSPWLDRRMLILNGHALHDALLPARDRLRGVFSGHLHRPAQTVRDGIAYCTVASTAYQITWRRGEDDLGFDAATPPGYMEARYFDDYAVATHYSF
ncbi:MAG TPA: metallophosphoesterase [Aggregatilinea sp.]|uniref:metallophosphoesterase n=1 Tax=Aggregatilinea sp. TaxID=2806333 RepID=UPI002CE7047F|nr:metallophosphoesterase [Aggregatilinea sp.]HML24703.1 metallophosphoesterase [Aggregatilinea sp.]